MGGGESVGVCVFEDGDDGLFEGSAFAVAVLPGVDWFDLAGLDLVVDGWVVEAKDFLGAGELVEKVSDGIADPVFAFGGGVEGQVEFGL